MPLSKKKKEKKKEVNSNVKWAKWENVRFEENFMWPTDFICERRYGE